MDFIVYISLYFQKIKNSMKERYLVDGRYKKII